VPRALNIRADEPAEVGRVSSGVESRVTVICEGCGAEFQAKRASRRFCSGRCQKRARRRLDPTNVIRPLSREVAAHLADLGLVVDVDSDASATAVGVMLIEHLAELELWPAIARLRNEALERIGLVEFLSADIVRTDDLPY
jgi:hypothetical protein